MIGNGKVFVSHTHADNERCEPLLAALDAWRIEYWYDGQQLDAGQQLSPRLQEAITQRDVLLRVCTTNTARSYWMNLEQSAFRATQFQQRKGASPRKSIDLVLDEGYTPQNAERADITITAVNTPSRVWLAALAAALGVKQREEPRGAISRRGLLGLGGAAAVTVASLAGAGVIVKTRDDAAAAPYPRPKTIAFNNPQSLDKRVKWYFKAGDSQGAALALSGALLLISSADGLYALDATDGSVLWWRPDVQGNALLAAVLAGDLLYVSVSQTLSGAIDAIRVADGTTAWSVSVPAQLGAGLALANNTLFLQADDNTIVAYSAHDGSLLWRSTTKIGSQTSLFRIPVADATGVYMGGNDAQFYALNPVDGSLRWTFLTGGSIDYTAAVANGMVYFGSEDQHLYALNTLSGSLAWQYTATVPVNYAPAVAGSTVYISAVSLIALDAASGALRWQAPLDPVTNETPSGSLAENAGVLYAPAGASLYAFDTSQQKPLWRFDTRPLDSNETPPVIAGTTAYWSSYDGAVYALDTTASA